MIRRSDVRDQIQASKWSACLHTNMNRLKSSPSTDSKDERAEERFKIKQLLRCCDLQFITCASELPSVWQASLEQKWHHLSDTAEWLSNNRQQMIVDPSKTSASTWPSQNKNHGSKYAYLVVVRATMGMMMQIWLLTKMLPEAKIADRDNFLFCQVSQEHQTCFWVAFSMTAHSDVQIELSTHHSAYSVGKRILRCILTASVLGSPSSFWAEATTALRLRADLPRPLIVDLETLFVCRPVTERRPGNGRIVLSATRGRVSWPVLRTIPAMFAARTNPRPFRECIMPINRNGDGCHQFSGWLR